MVKERSQLTPEMLVPRLGEALVRAGHISEFDLQKALAYQEEHALQGNSMLLGQALVDLKLIDQPTLDAAVTEQIIQLRSALQAANRVAGTIPWWSISSAVANPTPHAITCWRMSFRAACLSRGVSCLESRTPCSKPVMRRSVGRMTAAAATGPASAPRPASSIL